MEDMTASEDFYEAFATQTLQTNAADRAWKGLATLKSHLRLNHEASTLIEQRKSLAGESLRSTYHLAGIADEHVESLARHQIAVASLHLEVYCAKLHLLSRQHFQLVLGQLDLLK